MIKKIKELKTNAQHGIFPARDFCSFHNGEVSIEIVRSTKAIPSLGKCNRSAVTRSCRCWQVPRIKSGLASRLHEACVWIGRCTISQQLRWLARLGISGNAAPASHEFPD